MSRALNGLGGIGDHTRELFLAYLVTMMIPSQVTIVSQFIIMRGIGLYNSHLGLIAMLPIGTFIVPKLDDQDKYPHEFVTTFAPMPSWKDAEPGSTYTESHFYSISKTSKHPEEAFDFIRFYTTEGMKIRAINVSGEKGTDAVLSQDAGSKAFCIEKLLEKDMARTIH